MTNVLVIGAGAAGMISAIIAARNGNDVTIIEGTTKAGKKLYATGNGRCNFTNMFFDKNCFRGLEPSFAYNALEKFNNHDLISFFEELGVLYKDINGYVYPYSEQSSSIVEVLLAELKRLKVKIYLEENILDIYKKNNSFVCVGTVGNYFADKVIVAVGGISSPVHGSDGSLYPACERLGHTFVAQVPALVNLKFKDKSLSKLAGVRVKCKVYLYINDLPAYEESGELIFNKDNISGIPVMQLSRYCSYALKEGNKTAIHIDFFENYDDNRLRDLLLNRFYGTYSNGKTVYETLTGTLNNKLLDFLLCREGINPERKAGSLKPGEINNLIKLFKNFAIQISDTGSFDVAQVTAGGIPTSEILPSMESRLVNGLYFAGEILDIDGTCGGYNLQWAFTSGYIAGMLQ